MTTRSFSSGRAVVYFAVFLTSIGLMLAVRFFRSVASRLGVF
ncbi:hypothetical protein [Salinigranum halophilum]|nr:hypothetical protein [Salinigranum halophilum]